MLNSKSQIPNSKQIPITKIPITKHKVWDLDIGICNLLVIWCLVFGVCNNAYALNLDKVKPYLLKGDYCSCINEGEKIMASAGHSKDIDELYYVLGLCYLKNENYLRASDIFEIILKEFKNSAYREEAKLGLGDTYFLRGDFARAKDCYKELLSHYPQTKLKSQLYYRLSQIGYKQGDTLAAKEYLDKLRQDFPASLELKLSRDLYPVPDSPDFYYTVQVGAFSNITNAKNLTQKLIQQGYPAYMQESSSEGKTTYRVRVGKLRLRQEAVELEKKLIYEGYPTKIYP